VRHDNATLGHHRLEISIAQSVGDVPAHAQLNDLGIETGDVGKWDLGQLAWSFGVSWTPQLH
jgi:hypothetical protein